MLLHLNVADSVLRDSDTQRSNRELHVPQTWVPALHTGPRFISSSALKDYALGLDKSLRTVCLWAWLAKIILNILIHSCVMFVRLKRCLVM